MLLDTRLGDTTNHGGPIVTFSNDMTINAIPRCRLTDIHACPIHGPNPLVLCSPDADTDTLTNSRITAVSACGGMLVVGSPDSTTN